MRVQKNVELDTGDERNWKMGLNFLLYDPQEIVVVFVIIVKLGEWARAIFRRLC